MKLGIEGFHAIVTGGARGIGKAIVEALLREGCNVSYCARTVTGEEFAEFEEKEVGVQTQGRAVGRVLDLSKKDDIEPWVKAAADQFGRLDILISNGSPQVLTSEIEGWELSFQADIVGCVVLINSSITYLEKSPAPSIIINGSMVQGEVFFSPLGEIRESPYGPFKAALAHHSNIMAHVLGPKGIRVNTIAPGLIKFPGGGWEQACQEVPEKVTPCIDKVALGQGEERWGTPEQIADVTVFLSSPRARYISGASVVIDGAFRLSTQF